MDAITLVPKPSATWLQHSIDHLVDAHDLKEAEAAALRKSKDDIDAKIRAADAECEAIKIYLCEHMTRLGIESLKGETHRADRGVAAPKFEYAGKLEKLPKELVKVKLELDKGACKSAWERKALPKSIEVSRKTYVKFLRA